MQITGFMVTNGGAHPADKWGELTSNTIVDTILPQGSAADSDVSAAALASRTAKRALRNTLFDILTAHHQGVQQFEQTANVAITTAAGAAALALAPPDPTPHMTVMDQVNAAFAATPFKDHFAKPEVQALVAQIIGQHTADVMHIERRWHHDRLTKGA